MKNEKISTWKYVIKNGNSRAEKQNCKNKTIAGWDNSVKIEVRIHELEDR